MSKDEQHQYPKAGKKASKEVKKVIEEFRNLPLDKRKNKVLLYYILKSGTPSYKMPKPDSDYVDKSTVENQTCGNCEFAYKKVVSDAHICSQIDGLIKLEGWCRLWRPPKKAK